MKFPRRNYPKFKSIRVKTVLFFPMILLGLAGLTAVLLWSRPSNERPSYSPEPPVSRNEYLQSYAPKLCPGDANDRLYVRLVDTEYKRAFGFSMPRDLYKFPVQYVAKVPFPVIDTTVPLGCRENPLHSTGVPGAQFHGLRVWSKERMRVLFEQEFVNRCKKYNHRVQLTENLEVCYVAEAGVPDDALPLTAQADPTEYTTPLGRPFVFSCHGSINDRPPRHFCRVSYEVEPGLGFFYSFSEVYDPLESIIEKDREWRKWIQSIRFPDLDYRFER